MKKSAGKEAAMTNWIDRYTYEVVRRLPESDRDEVKRELASNIYDMLPENPTEEQIKEILSDLGSPSAMAEKYRSKPRYLIGPALYDSYLHTLKWLAPLIGCILLVVGALLGFFNGIEDGNRSAAEIAVSIFSQGLSFGVSGVFQAFFWVTLGFVIAERTGAAAALNSKWSVEDLKDVIPENKKEISLADSIVELVIIVVFSIIFLLVCLDVIPIAFAIKSGDLEVRHLFADSFIATLIPAIIIGAIFGVIECVTKITARRWTPAVCAVVIVDAVVGIALSFFLFARSHIFSPEFISFIEVQSGFKPEYERFLLGFPENPIIIALLVIIVIASLGSIGVAIYRTLKAKTPSGNR